MLPSAALSLLGPGLSALLLSGCFLGDAADGLECELDADCGIGVECVADPAAAGAKCCGGSCLVAGDSTGPSSTSTTTGSESSSSSEDSNTTMVDLCGNGVVDADEICDASAPDGPDCGPSCTLCGNDFVNEGEGCDEDDNDNCGDDCQYIFPCGNGFVDPGEACDVWGVPDGQTCSLDCSEWIAFEWNAPEPGGFCRDDGDCSRWGRLPVGGAWGSGLYIQTEEPWLGPPAWPEAVLRTEPMAFPMLEDGDVVRVTLDHGFSLNYQFDPVLFIDHVEVALESAGRDSVARNIPLRNDSISCADGVGDMCGVSPVEQEYCGDEDQLVRAAGELTRAASPPTYTYVVPERGIPAGDQRLRFRVRYDCFNFENGGLTPPVVGPDAWKIHGVTVRIEKG